MINLIKRSPIKITVLAFLSLIIFSSCKEDEGPFNNLKKEPDGLRQFVYDTAKKHYLWNDSIPSLTPNNYPSANYLLNNKIKVQPDAFSGLLSQQQFDNQISGRRTGIFGIALGSAGLDDLRIRYIFKQSPLYDDGVRRGWRIVSMNGISASELIHSTSVSEQTVSGTNNFVFINNSGDTVNVSGSPATFTQNSVIFDTIYNLDNSKTGYFVLNGFLENTPQELESVMTKFSNANINDLLVDFRYNGGGLLTGSAILASYIRGNGHTQEPFTLVQFNNSRSNQDFALPFIDTENPLSLNSVYFITSGNTASASELVINGLEPYMDVQVIGSRTYGKPVGSQGYDYETPDDSEFINYTLNLINIRLANANEEGNYFNGLPVDKTVGLDDYTLPWGDPNEERVRQALYHIENGSYDEITARKLKKERAYEDKDHKTYKLNYLREEDIKRYK